MRSAYIEAVSAEDWHLKKGQCLVASSHVFAPENVEEPRQILIGATSQAGSGMPFSNKDARGRRDDTQQLRNRSLWQRCGGAQQGHARTIGDPNSTLASFGALYREDRIVITGGARACFDQLLPGDVQQPGHIIGNVMDAQNAFLPLLALIRFGRLDMRAIKPIVFTLPDLEAGTWELLGGTCSKRGQKASSERPLLDRLCSCFGQRTFFSTILRRMIDLAGGAGVSLVRIPTADSQLGASQLELDHQLI